MVKSVSLIEKLTTAKGWSVQEKYPYELKDAEGNVIETLYIRPLSRSRYKEIAKRVEEAGEDASGLTLRMVVECCYFQDGTKAFSNADIVKLSKEVSSTMLNDLEMAVLNAGRNLDVATEKKG